MFKLVIRHMFIIEFKIVLVNKVIALVKKSK